MKRILLALALSISPSISSCTRAPVVNPSPVQSIDLTIARSLLDAQTIIEQSKPLAANKPAVKDTLNKIIISYNTIQDSYKIYHQAIVSGGNPDSTALQAQVAGLLSSISQLVGMLK